MLKRNLFLITGLMLLEAGVSSVAMAQLDEITVTARFREEAIQDIGGSVSALGEEQLNQLVDFDELAGLIVGLNITDEGRSSSEVSIRGVSNDAPAFQWTGSTSPLVSQFIDDIPTAASVSYQRDFNYFDFDRVEVLRGPQPTLFGEGSMGGTIRYFTRSPDLSGDSISDGIIKLGTSHTEDGGMNYSASAAATLVLAPDTFAIRGVVNYSEEDGYIDNPSLGQKNLNDYDEVSGRLVALYDSGSRLTARVSALFGRDNYGDKTFVDPLLSPEDLITDKVNLRGRGEDDFSLFSANLSYEFDNLTFTSITGFFERDKSESYEDGVIPGFLAFLGFPGLVGEFSFGADDQSLTQEFRLVSDFDGRMNFAAGLFYQDTELETGSGVIVPGLAAIAPDGNTVGFTSASAIETRQYSVFFEGTFDVTDKFRLIVGARYVDEKIDNTELVSDSLSPVDFSFLDSLALLELLGIPTTAEFQLEDWLPRASFEYDVSDDVMLYGIVSTGIRNGNLNPASTALQLAAAPTAEEVARVISFEDDGVLSIEAGMRGSWHDGDLITNLAFYHLTFKDAQIEIFSPFGFPAVDNGPDQEAIGVELETSWNINESLNTYLNVAYQDFEFESAFASYSTVPTPDGIDIAKGNRPVNTPEWSISTGLNIDRRIGNADTRLIGHLGYQFLGDRNSFAQNFPSTELDELHLVNLRLGVENDAWTLNAFINNATNDIQYVKKFTTAGQSFPLPSGQLDAFVSSANINRPRTIGINLIRRF